eukprot:COSAG05_NODE_2975_length_2447_cov_4.449725_2_plen_355_part_00
MIRVLQRTVDLERSPHTLHMAGRSRFLNFSAAKRCRKFTWEKYPPVFGLPFASVSALPRGTCSLSVPGAGAANMSRAPNFDPTRPPSEARTGSAAARRKQAALDDFQQKLRGVMEPLLEALLVTKPADPASFTVGRLGGDSDAVSGAQKMDALHSELTLLRQQMQDAGFGTAEGAAATKVQAMQRGRAGRRKVAEKKEEKGQASAATKLQAAQRGKQARAKVSAKKEEIAEQTGAAAKIQAAHRGKQGRTQFEEKKAIATATEFKSSTASHDLARTLSQERGSTPVSKLRSIVKGRSRKTATVFMKMAQPEAFEEDDSDDERYSAGSAWLRQRDQQHAMEIAQRLHGESTTPRL